jgi:hypothetical protein
MVSPHPFWFIVPPQSGFSAFILCLMIQPPGCWFDALCSWLESVAAFSAIGITLAPSHD